MPGIDNIRKRYRHVREPLTAGLADADMLQYGEEKMGTGYNNVTQSDGKVEINNSDKAIGMQMSVGDSHLKMGGQMSTDMNVEKTSHNGRSFNPQLKYRGTNMISHFSPITKTPPSFETRLIRGVLGAMVTIIKTFREQSQAEE